jgi:acetyltransferase-like isoleucine patch superfamily enzyme
LKLLSYLAFWIYRLRRQRGLAMASEMLSRFHYSGSRTRRILQMAGAKVGGGCTIRAPLFIDSDIGLNIGERVFINTGLTIVGSGPVKLGDFALLGPNVTLATAYHPLDPDLRRVERQVAAAAIEIGSNAWIGANVTICPGVRIGEGATVGAGSVVTRDVPARTLAAGVPCRVIRPL